MTPTATYRLQLQPEFPFAAAATAVPRLARLGISHLHLSPVLTSVPGSTHGYDVTDHTRVRAELGGEEGLRALSGTARAHGLGLILDLVPNHMAAPADLRLNAPLWQLLRDGPGSPYARWFDIDWAAGGERVLWPVLAGPLRTEHANLRVRDGRLHYGQHVLPLREGTDHLPLPELLDAQHYRLSWWRLARTELNYRRFFTISELIGLRVEDPEVFAATHGTMLRLLREGVADGLRVDHPDGLADPDAYLRRLHEATGGRWTVVEKILAPGETLPGGWPVAGTTGYDALRQIDGLFTDPRGHAELAALYRDSTAVPADRGGDWAATARRAARKAAVATLAAETERLTRAAVRACDAAGLRLRDHAPWALRTALREVLVRLPVYRPYVSFGGPVREGDAAMLEAAAEGARTAFDDPGEGEAADAVRDLALGRVGDGPEARDFAARFAQVSGALRAKALEDTACYRYVPLLSASEVGGDPGRPAVSPDGFHSYCARIQRDWPTTGTVLSTHDTKRSADVRATLALLSECPQSWAALVDKATRQTERVPGGRAVPDPHLAWTAWQTALGLEPGLELELEPEPPPQPQPQPQPQPSSAASANGTPRCPDPPERLMATLLKSVREAGLWTSWADPDAAYEAAVERFVTAGPCGPAGETLAQWAREVAPQAEANILGMALLHLTMPGVPDLYMGTERPYRALVDPDNRRPPGTLGLGASDSPPPGGKPRLTAAALRLRRAHPEWFLEGSSYAPLRAEGAAAEHCVAFVRSGSVVTAVTRLSLRLRDRGGWDDTELPLPEGRWRELLTERVLEGGRCRVAELLDGSPVALLVRA
ncbi:malto-oligosyltrehalose synthase [Streptomyces sp. N2-109]|uniref:Malto-oligosyltrehalose synthase n=1 Tax=Streptomyces gossypii TaxID=2883101 RepID=A0ABT2JSQ0_9ACTN|nr:malto-oligosyltrehalose synthase [Streptomyces gossypii]MCT2590888.1 malto-oligosyltrehalose synthase [Streptomyces gossypii]